MAEYGKNAHEIAKKLGLSADNVVVQTIAERIGALPKRLMQCTPCDRKFNVANARDGGIYRCIKCNSVLTDVTPTAAQTIEASDAEIILDEAVPEEVQRALDKPESVCGKFVLVSKIGEGAMGEVWKGFDVELGRYVALKFLKTPRIEELKAEARTLAALEHKNICRIYEIGTFKERAFIAMQLIDGMRISESGLRIEDILNAMITACEAVDYANKFGVIHRDLKPENIMVDKIGNVFIMDFGIASRSPAFGDVAGTPGYMAPEIARRLPASPRSDVYSLTATIYWLLSRRLPISIDPTQHIETMLNVIAESKSVPIRRVISDFPAELEAIISKGLDANPDARYESAAELAADLRRYLDGEPVNAFRNDVPYRFKKKAAKHPFVSIIIAASVILVSAAGFVAYKKAVDETAKEQAAAEQKKKTGELLQGFLDACSQTTNEVLRMRRNGAAYAAYSSMLKPIELVYNKVLDQGGRDKNVHCNMGQLYRIVGSDEKALEQQNMALAIDPSFKPAAYERAHLLWKSYERKIQALRDLWVRRESANFSGEWNIPNDSQLEDDAARGIRNEVGKTLTAAFPEVLKAQGSGEDSLTQRARGYYMLTIGLAKKAELFFAQAFKADPSAEECCLMLTRIYEKRNEMGKGIEICTAGLDAIKGSYELYCVRGRLWRKDEQEFAATEEDFRKSLELRPDYSDALFERAKVRLSNALGSFSSGKTGDNWITKAIEDYDKLLKWNDKDSRALSGKGEALSDWGYHLDRRGENPESLYASGIDCFTKCLEISPQDGEALYSRGITFMNLAVYKMNHGANPTDDLQAASKDFDAAIKVDRGSFGLWIGKGMVSYNFAALQMNAGKDALDLFRDSVKSFTEALKLRENSVQARMMRGDSYVSIANFEQMNGKDPTKEYENAFADLNAVVKESPQNFESWLYRGRAFAKQGNFLKSAGKDPTEAYTKAIADFDESLNLNKSNSETWLRRGKTLTLLANYRGGDPTSMLEEAIESLEKAFQFNATNSDALIALAMTRADLANFKRRNGQDASEVFARALKDLDHAEQHNRGNCELWMSRGATYYFMADQAASSGSDPSENYKKAITNFDAAIELNERCADAWMRRGIARLEFGSYKESVGMECEQDYETAAVDFESAIKINSLAPEFHKRLGMANGSLASLYARTGKDASQSYRKTMDCLEKAVDMNPSDAHCHFLLGFYGCGYSTFLLKKKLPFDKIIDDSISHLETAAKLAPQMTAQINEVLKAALELKSKSDY